MDLLTRLKIDTRPRHQQTETVLYADKLMAGTLTHNEYVQLLIIHYRFHQALETAIANQARFFADYEADARRKTPWLVTDLQQAEVNLPAPAPGLFTDWTTYQLLGALYVAEGSTLGGRVIAGALRRTPGLGGLTSRFFGGYGEQTGPLWKLFGAWLIQRADNHDEEIVEAANRTFGHFQQLAVQTSMLAPAANPVTDWLSSYPEPLFTADVCLR